MLEAGHPAALVGKVVTWAWSFEVPQPGFVAWRVRVDVQQDAVSLPGYPAEYSGPLALEQHPARFRISEDVEAAS